MTKRDAEKPKSADSKLSMHPLPIEDALRGAMATGKPPEMPKRERSPAAKRRRRPKSKESSDA